MKNIAILVGTRPNFVKITQFKKVVNEYPELNVTIIHTGQHYDNRMADVFFEQFSLCPDHFMNIAAGSPNSQMAEIMSKLEGIFSEKGSPDILMVVGDVNSTLAAALTAHKMNIPLAHLESGLRSFDRTMPEEINRILTDELADYFFVTEQSGVDNLIKEGKSSDRIFLVGNTMIDTLMFYQSGINSSPILETLEVKENEYALMTMHRPATVDNAIGLRKLLDIMNRITEYFPLVFPIHPRTLKMLEVFELSKHFLDNPRIRMTEPLDYFSFQKLIAKSKFIITDSGGIQEESTFVGKPCLTMRPNTERPVTCSIGTNTLIPFDAQVIQEYIGQIISGKYKKGANPPMWDGNATKRIVSIISKL